jgi:hypothetical protein
MFEKLAAGSRVRIWWLAAALAISIVLAGFQFYALANFLYWKYSWFDIPMHILGALGIGAFLIGVSSIRRPISYLLAMAAISVSWEVMEYVGGLTRYEHLFLFDTAHDLLDDAIGATLAYLIARLTIWHSA